MRIELHIANELWDSAETTPEKKDWMIKAMKAKWTRELFAFQDWEIFIIHTSKLTHDKNNFLPIYRHRYNAVVKNKKARR